MALTANLEMVKNVAKITLSGDLDASSAPVLKEKIEDAAKKQAKRLVLMMQDLAYIASAGIRVLIFAKQKMGAKVDIFVVAPQAQISETLEMTGLQHSVTILPEYDAAQIENV